MYKRLKLYNLDTLRFQQNVDIYILSAFTTAHGQFIPIEVEVRKIFDVSLQDKLSPKFSQLSRAVEISVSISHDPISINHPNFIF